MQVSEDVWEDLLAYAQEGKVVPVIGPELLTVPIDAGELGFYRLIAERLAQRYRLQIDSQSRGELNDVVCAYLGQARRARMEDLYRPINDILKALNPPVPLALRQLAAIRSFDLFVTTTFDSLMVEAINQERFSGAPRTLQIAYAPNLSTDVRRDIPDARAPGEAVVFHLFGKASASPDYAIHDEDVLEFVHALQSGRDMLPERLFAELRQRHLLIVGCPFPDWLGRFFIRMASSERLSLARPRKEFIAAREAAQDRNLAVFLEHFSYSTTVFPASAAEFVAELHRRWSERNPARSETVQDPAGASAPIEKGAIFISYTRQDTAAARVLCEVVREIGGDVSWLDKERLAPGNDWEQEILRSIRREARLFLALISRNTEAREEGFFRKEWREAVERAKGIQGRDFIVPVIVDADYVPGHYGLIPEDFRRFDFGWAPEGRPDERLRDKLIKEIRALRREEVR